MVRWVKKDKKKKGIKRKIGESAFFYTRMVPMEGAGFYLAA